MTWLEALILGVIQGLTEFLPVSSSGHLELGTALLGVKSTENLLFAVVVHSGTALSTVVVFRKDILDLLKGLFPIQWNESWKFSLKILVSMIPVAIVGVFFKDQVESLFIGNLLLVGSMLIVTSFLLFITYFIKNTGKEVTRWHAIIMGVAQAVAVLPGISRSGSTIAMGLILGADKEKVTRFSFLMVLIPILGASLLELKDYLETPELHTGTAVFPLIIGFCSAFLAGYVACKWMISIVKKGKLTYFALYCAVVGLIAIVFSIL